jgi:hypothetical protein
MTCKKCGSQKVLVESVGDGKTRTICQETECRYAEINDQQGRRMLTDDMAPPHPAKILTERRC